MVATNPLSLSKLLFSKVTRSINGFKSIVFCNGEFCNILKYVYNAVDEAFDKLSNKVSTCLSVYIVLEVIFFCLIGPVFEPPKDNQMELESTMIFSSGDAFI